jgi:hypothetical protein
MKLYMPSHIMYFLMKNKMFVHGLIMFPRDYPFDQSGFGAFLCMDSFQAYDSMFLFLNHLSPI